MVDVKPWMLPLIVVAIAVPIVAGFAVGGPVVGVALGFIAAAALALVAARLKPRGPISAAAAPDIRRRILVVAAHEIDEPAAIERIRAETRIEESAEPVEVLVLVPARSSTLDRWATDVRRSRQEAQRKLVVSLASLGKADVAATAVVGDEDVIQAVEDQLRTYAATEVILITGTPEADPAGERAARELAERLDPPLMRIALADRG